jgi:hypothetical protein
VPGNSLDVAAPDLSHLTPEERAIIQGVMIKQQEGTSKIVVRFFFFTCTFDIHFPPIFAKFKNTNLVRCTTMTTNFKSITEVHEIQG